MDRTLRAATPIVLLVLAFLVWFEAWLPGSGWVRANLGELAVLRFVLGLLCVYMVLLVIERHRMEVLFKQVLLQFREFHGRTAGGAGSGAAEDDQKQTLEAVRILIAALESSDERVRATALENLRKLTGQELGPDVGAWRSWLAAAEKQAKGS